MNLKFFRYFIVLFLLLGTLIFFSSEVTATCYVKGLVCSPTNLGYGSVSYLNIAEDDCFAGVYDNNNEGMAPECVQGCCCNIYSGGVRSGVPMLKGACNNAYPFIPGVVAGTSGCVNICKTTGTVQKFNITGNVLVAGIPTQGVKVKLNTLEVATNSTGGYTFTNIDNNAYYIINAEINGCTNSTQQFYLTSNTQKNIGIKCDSYNISGIIYRDENGISTPVIGSNVSTDKGQSVISDSDGYYKISGIIKGTNLAISANDSACTGYISVTADTDKYNQDIHITCTTWNITGMILDESNLPIDNADVSTNVKSGAGSSTKSSIYGEYTLLNIPASVGNNRVTIRASTQTQQLTAETSRVCSGELQNINLDSNKTDQNVILKCCTTSCITDTCVNNKKTQRCTSEGSGCVETGTKTTQISCSSLPACDWTCDGWQPVGPGGKCPSGVFSQTQTCTRIASTASNPCDPTIPVAKPLEVRDCNMQCGDGILNASLGEECDYNQFNGIFNTTATSACMTDWTSAGITYANLQTAGYIMDSTIAKGICNFNNCSCIRKEPEIIPPTVCTIDPKNISQFNISSIPMTKAFTLKWLMQDESCKDYIDKFELRICDNTSGNCVIPELAVNLSINHTNRSYIHNNTASIARTQYCYQLTAVFNDSVAHPPGEPHKVSNITCITTGDEECMTTHTDNFCKSNNVVNCSAINNTLELEQNCSINTDDYKTPGYCSFLDGKAACREQGPCDQCNSFFGLFSYQGFRLPVISDTNSRILLCPSIQHPHPDEFNQPLYNGIYGCYLDYSSTTIDKAYSCSDVKSCYDYLSENSCTQDYCGLFTTNPCEWANYTATGLTSNVFKKGVCRPVEEEQQNCSVCQVEKNNRLYSKCTSDICKMYGKCYFQTETGKCMNQRDVKCTDYLNYQDCIGVDYKNSYTYVGWSTDSFGIKKFVKILGNNSLDKSNDYVGLGVCKWMEDDSFLSYFQGNKCVRDADNNTIGPSAGGLRDCILPIYGATANDNVLRSLCERDTQSPNTTIINSTRYGLVMNLDGKVNIADKLNVKYNSPWIVGDDTFGTTNKKIHMITHYCVVPQFAQPCYPNLTINIADDRYNINLYELSNGTPDVKIGLADNDRNFTIYYFSEDPARNLELIKNFTFNLDSKPPNVSVNFSMYSFRISKAQWLTNLNVTLILNETDKSGAVECSFKIRPVGEDRLFLLSFGNKKALNIPTWARPYDKWLNVVGDKLNTSYPRLSDGQYEYNLTCIDKSNNRLEMIRPLFIEGDLAITNPKPNAETFRYNSPTQTFKPFPGNISINTTGPGVCRFSNYSNKLYKDMTDIFLTTNNGRFHNSTATVPLNASGSPISGIYRYYVACNLSINNQYEIIAGDSSDMPIFAIDELPPKTDVLYRTNNNPLRVYNSNAPVMSKMTFALNCSDEDSSLTTESEDSMAFGCDEIMYYCIPKIDGTESCNPLDKTTYDEITSEDRPELDYMDGGANKRKYGNNPIIYFYSKDSGNNTESVKSVKLLLKDTTFALLPTISFEPDFATNIVTIEDPTTIIVNYTSESNVSIVFSLFKNNGGSLQYVPVTLDGEGLQGRSVYRFIRQYFPNGNYVIKINATDDDDNNQSFQTTFQVNHGPASVGLISPPMGVGSESSYPITLGTSTPSACKYNLGDITGCDAQTQPLKCRYDNYDKEITLRSENDRIHRFTYPNEEGVMHVVCKLNYSLDDSDASYAYTAFHVGIVSTNPKINITYIQNPFTNLQDNIIINPDNMTTKIQVITDQLAVCRIKSVDATKPILIVDSLFNGQSDILNYRSYMKVHNFTINYSGKDTYSGTFNYNINCTNLAQFTNESNAAITIDLDYSNPAVNLETIYEQSNLIKKVMRVNCVDHCTDRYWYKIVNLTATCGGTSKAWYSPASPLTGRPYTYNITITNTSKVCLLVEDILGRQNATEEIVSVMQLNRGEINISEPPYIFTTDGTLRLYSENRSFELNISTAFNATCRYAYVNNIVLPPGMTAAQIPQFVYESSSILFINTSNSTYNSTNHSTYITLDTREGDDEGLIIVCEAKGVGEADKYIVRTMFMYWDNSSPIITRLYVQPRIYDWNDRLNVAVIADTDDDTICVINDSINVLLAYEDDLFDFSDYSNHHDYTYNLFNIMSAEELNDINHVQDINLNLTCYNRARLSGSKNGTTHYEMDRKINIIRISNDTFKGVNANTQIPIEVNTSIKGNCTLYIDDENKGQLPTTNRLNHKTTIKFPTSGKYNIKIHCEVPGRIDIADSDLEYILYADGRAPTLGFELNNFNYINGKYYTCNLNSFTINVNLEDDTDIAGYNYSVLVGTTKIINGVFVPSGTISTITFPQIGGLEDGKTYKVQAKAIDKVGNFGVLETVDIVAASPSTGIACDGKSPAIAINLIKYYGDNDANVNSFAVVNVTCEDTADSTNSATNCTNSFNYSFRSGKSDCSGAEYELVGKYTKKILIQDNGTLCVQGRDYAFNPAEKSMSFTITKTQCGNGIIERKPTAAELGLSDIAFNNWNSVTNAAFASIVTETCDGSLPSDKSCFTQGFIGGTLDCNVQTCQLDTSLCDEGMDVSLTNPLPFGIGTSQIYNLNVTSEYNAVCKYGLISGSNIVTAFNLMSKSMSQEADRTRHNLTINSSNSGPVYLPRYVICNATDQTGLSNPAAAYGMTQVYEGYDYSVPSITASTNRLNDTVNDFNDRKIDIIAKTDDNTICLLTDSIGVNVDVTMNDYDAYLNEYNEYTKDHQYTVDYSAILGEDTITDIKYNITCMNRAGLLNKTNITVHYNITKDLIITKISPDKDFATSTSATYIIKTNILSNCTINNGTLTQSMGTAYDTEHQKAIKIAPGENTITITCQNGIQAVPVTKVYHIYGGASVPINMHINTEPFICSASTITATLQATSTIRAISTYNYTIRDLTDGIILISANSNGPVSYNPIGGVISGHNYQIQAFAIDTLGQTSASDTQLLTGSNPDSKECDRTAPILRIIEIPTGYLDVTRVNVTCDDGTGSGCTNKYYYKIIGSNESCNNTPTNTKYRSYADILTLREAGKLCVRGLDNSNNEGYAELNISLITNNTLNITLIPPPSIVYPNVLVTTTPLTNITLSTANNAVCRYSQNTPGTAPLSQVYANSTSFNNTGTTQHQIINFNTNSLYRQYVNIVCNATGMSGNNYSSITIEVVYINSSILPTIIATANPNVIIDWNDRKTELSITTDIDTVCTINSPTDFNRPVIYSGNINDATTYSRHHYETIEYDTDTVSPSNHTYDISCKNLALTQNNASVNVSYNLSSIFTVEMASPNAFRIGTIDVIAKTNLLATCKVNLNGTNKGDMSVSATKNHLMRITGLTNGTYAIEFICITPYRPLETSANYTIIINSSLPDPNAVRCGDGIINQAPGVEECDGNALNGKTCSSGWITTNYTGGVLKCGLPGTPNQCKYDKSMCDDGKGYCGNNRVEGPNTQNIFEQCDGNIRSGLTCKDFGYKYGSLSCTNTCRVNTSDCSHVTGGLGTLGRGNYTCRVNNQLESGEQCETAGIFGISCESFGYDGGTITCGNCDYVLSGCYFDAPNNRTGSGSCNNNNIKDSNEECDGTAGLSTVSCRTLGNFTSGNVSCTRTCKYDTSRCIRGTINTTTNQSLCSNGKKDIAEADIDCGGSCGACALNKSCFTNNDCGSKKCVASKCVIDTCNNSKFDNGTETDIDCGKTCKSCSIDRNCSSNADCTSKNCVRGRCAADPCSNGIKDDGEGDIDCGGNCEQCEIGNSCSLDSDCGTNSCVENLCVEPLPPKNPVKLPLMIIGIVSTVGSAGYIVYKTFINKPMGGTGGMRPPMNMPPPMPSRPAKLTPEQEQMIARQREAMLKKRQGRANERKGVLQKLEETLTGKSSEKEDKDELKTIPASKPIQNETDGEGFVDVSKIKGKKEKENTFDKLKDISKNNTEGSAFDKLKTFKIDEVSKKISQISGSSQESIKPALSGKEELGYSQAIKMFGNVDRDMIMSGIFKEILSKLLDSGKLTKEHVSNILFEYMDKGIITKSDVAKLTSELKII